MALARYCHRCGGPLSQSAAPVVDGGPAIRSATTLTPLLQQWRSLKYDMTRKEARRVLGEPARIEPQGDKDGLPLAEVWVYSYEAEGTKERVSGVLKLTWPDGRLTSWTEPDWSAIASTSKP